MVVREPQAAGDYDDRTTAAVKSVLIEIGQILGSFEGKFAIIGGAVPWLLLGEAEMQHVGTADVDLGLDPAALGDGEYARLVEALQEHGYLQRDNLRRFQLLRTVPAADDGSDIDVVVDFLMPRDAEITRNTPPLISQFAVQRADGADLALRFYQMVAIEGHMPDGDRNRVSIAVASIPALLAMKGYALARPSETQGCLRHLLLRKELPGRNRRPRRSNPAPSRCRVSPPGIPLDLRQVSECRGFRAVERAKVC